MRISYFPILYFQNEPSIKKYQIKHHYVLGFNTTFMSCMCQNIASILVN